MLLIDDQQSQVTEIEVALQQLVGAHQDIDLAIAQAPVDRADLLGRLEARDHVDGHRPICKSIAKGIVVLLGEQGGWYQHSDLLAGLSCDESGAHGDLCLAESDVPAHQAVHHPGAAHILEYGGNCCRLIRRLLKREAGSEALVGLLAKIESETFTCLAAGVDVQ